MRRTDESLIFVYGTLKQGFKNSHLNRGRRIGDAWRSEIAWPLYIIGADALPWLTPLAGQGHRVQGELVSVDGDALRLMDALEQVDDPGWYRRLPLWVSDGLNRVRAQAYFGAPERLASEPIWAGPLSVFTPAWNERYSEQYSERYGSFLHTP